ncbi:hypothetical protein Y1Q_0003403 [Alligator mississippiensis]|uniref:UPAR/Ly6 domain-containing protein n=1 Tax=Alligator mississippiensis TaxID=8496 RepID=A0A151M3Y2_ALLMI|nr:hypothetical protein Y1Q_0003403 [Alligator mississippiensis]
MVTCQGCCGTTITDQCCTPVNNTPSGDPDEVVYCTRAENHCMVFCMGMSRESPVKIRPHNCIRDLQYPPLSVPTMKAPVALLLLLLLLFLDVLLVAGSSMWCEVCSSLGTNCTGPNQKCSVGNNTCATILTEIAWGGNQTRGISKGCIPTAACGLRHFVTHFQGRVINNSVSCCTGATCKMALGNLSLENDTQNNFRCPACSSSSPDCLDRSIKCVRDENRCLEMKQEEISENPPINTTIWACVTKDTCADLKVNPTIFGGRAGTAVPQRAPSIIQDLAFMMKAPVTFLFLLAAPLDVGSEAFQHRSLGPCVERVLNRLDLCSLEDSLVRVFCWTCLQCEVCLGLGMNCSGSIQECNTGENTCFHALIESSTNGQKKSIQAIRGCVTSHVCGWSPAIFHSEVKYKIAFTCCTGDSCRTTFPQLPEDSFIPNGLYCPCKPKVESNYCNNAWLACTEEESQCLNFTETLTFGLAKVQNSIMGCATPSACNIEDMSKKILEKLGTHLKALVSTTWIHQSESFTVLKTLPSAQPPLAPRMKAPVILLFLSALLAAGTCLECEVCSGLGNTCNGKMTTCSSGEDSCFLALIESSESFNSVKYIQTVKGCVTSRVCGRSPAIFNSAQKQRIALTCCTGNSCKTASAQLSAENIIPNGLYCPYCTVLRNTYSCNATVLACTGEENQCLNITGSHGSGPGNSMKSILTIKGCTTSRICEQSPAIFRSSVTYRLAFACCTGDSCKHTSVQLPAENIIPNGLYCPTCVTTGDTNDCSKMFACSGEETECLHLTDPVSSNPGAAKPPTPYQGCATPPTCKLGDAIKNFGIPQSPAVSRAGSSGPVSPFFSILRVHCT